MCVSQCLQSCSNGKRGVMIFTPIAEQHRHRVWPCLLFPNLFLLLLSPPPASCFLSLYSHPPSFLLGPSPPLSSFSQSFCHMCFYPWHCPITQFSSLILYPWLKEKVSFPPNSHDCLTMASTVCTLALLKETTHFTEQPREGNYLGGKAHWWIPGLWVSTSFSLALEKLWWGHDPLEVYKEENRQYLRHMPSCCTGWTITASNQTDTQRQRPRE